MSITQRKLDGVKALASEDGLIDVACFHFINLELVKTATGSAWAGMRDKIYDTGEGFLENRLSKDDIIIRSQDGYLVVLAHTTPTTTTLLIEDIRNDILEFFLGDEYLKKLKVAASHERMSVTAVSDTILDMGETSPSLDMEETSPSLDLNLSSDDPLQNMSFSYHPIWNSLSNRISNYSLVPYNKMGKKIQTGRDVLHGDPSAELVQKLDFLMLTKAQEDFSNLHSMGETTAISLTVSFKTLIDSKARADYVNQLSKLPEHYQKNFLICVDQIPVGTPEYKLVENIGFLSNLCGKILIHNLDPSINLASFRGCRTSLFGFDLDQFIDPNNKLSADEIQKITDFCGRAKKMQHRVYFTKVQHRNQILELKRAGVHYFSGNSIGPPLPSPIRLRELTPRDIFQRTDTKFT